MRRLQQLLAIILLGASCILVVSLVVGLYRAESQLRYTSDNLNRLIRESAQTVANLRHTSAVVEKNSGLEARGITQATRQLDSDLRDLDALIADADTQVNTLGPQVGDEIVAVKPILKNATDATASLAKIAQDPDIPDSLRQLDASTRSLAKTTADASATVADVRTGVDYELHELMKPVRKIKVALQFVATIAGKFFGF